MGQCDIPEHSEALGQISNIALSFAGRVSLLEKFMWHDGMFTMRGVGDVSND